MSKVLIGISLKDMIVLKNSFLYPRIVLVLLILNKIEFFKIFV